MNLPSLVLVAILSTILAGGCNRSEEITAYRVPKEKNPREQGENALDVRRPTDNDSSNQVELKYQTPEGWTEQPASGFRKAAFAVSEGDDRVEVTIIDLPPSAGDILANVNRWRGQIGLPPTDAAEVAESSREVTVAGRRSIFTEMLGSEDASPRQSILAAIVPTEDRIWFIKLQGNATTAESEKERFEAFLNSLKF